LLNSVIDPAGYAQSTSPKIKSHIYDVSGQYFMLKFADVVSVWFENLKAPDLVTVYVDTGKQMGLSHVTSNGVVTPVPGPGALALLGLGLAGLGAARRRKADEAKAAAVASLDRLSKRVRNDPLDDQ
jgi:hypothetical protein